MFKNNKNYTLKGKALKITIIYLVFGCLWIILTDNIVEKIFLDPNDIIIVNIIKGLFYVATTAILIYLLIYSSFKKLKQNEERFKRSQEIAKSGSWEIEPGSNMVWASDQVFCLLGLETKTNLISIEDVESMIHEEDREEAHNALVDLINDKKKYDIEYRIKPYGKGESCYVHSIAEKQYDKKKDKVRILGVIIDITERKKLKETIKFSNKDLLESQRIARVGTWRLDIDSNRVIWSDELYKMYGFDPTLPPPPYNEHMKLFTSESWDRLSKALESTRTIGKPYELELKTVGENGSNGWMWVRGEAEKDSNGNIISIWGAAQDITERKKQEEEKSLLEAQVQNQQKLESIGTLASGVAHEINNPINGILNYGQVILDATAAGSDINKYAGEIIYETKRVSGIVKNLLDFSRQSGEQHSYAQIEDIIGKTLSLINTIFRHDNISLNVDISKNISKIKCRSQQIQQVLMNLLTNARDSLNEKYPEYHENKKINIECHEFSKDKRKWISISIEDFGTGIPEDVKHRIFDPFFTTKAKDKGTGLGLSISYGIIKEHHGEIKVDSKGGEYTKFTIILPCDNGWDINEK